MITSATAQRRRRATYLASLLGASAAGAVLLLGSAASAPVSVHSFAQTMKADDGNGGGNGGNDGGTTQPQFYCMGGTKGHNSCDSGQNANKPPANDNNG